MAAHKKVPAGTGTPEESASTVAEPQQPEISCPRCGGIAERLPAGQDQPTTEQSYQHCWTLADGSQPGEPGPAGRGRLCSLERRLDAGLLLQIEARIIGGDERGLHPLKVARRGWGETTLSLIRFAEQHPLASHELALLLLHRLEAVWIQCPEPDWPLPSAWLHLQLRGRGGAAALSIRHRDELRAVLADLLGDGLDLPVPEWGDGGSGRSCWLHGDHVRLTHVEISEQDGGGRWLSWPDLQEVGRNG